MIVGTERVIDVLLATDPSMSHHYEVTKPGLQFDNLCFQGRGAGLLPGHHHSRGWSDLQTPQCGGQDQCRCGQEGVYGWVGIHLILYTVYLTQ